MDIDYALVFDFLDEDGRPRQLRFRRDETPADPAETLCGTGQLVAVIADPGRPDHGHTIAISRPGVRFADVERALDGWRSWAMITDGAVNLVEITRRIHAAALD